MIEIVRDCCCALGIISLLVLFYHYHRSLLQCQRALRHIILTHERHQNDFEHHASQITKYIAHAETQQEQGLDTHPHPPTHTHTCLLYTSPSPRDGLLSRMPSSA